jgi:hypothetical protein
VNVSLDPYYDNPLIAARWMGNDIEFFPSPNQLDDILEAETSFSLEPLIFLRVPADIHGLNVLHMQYKIKTHIAPLEVEWGTTLS